MNLTLHSGSLGYRLHAQYGVAIPPAALALQVIQVFYGTPLQDDPADILTWSYEGREFTGFVDGAWRSRRVQVDQNPEKNEGTPYYYSEQEAQGAVNDDRIDIFDAPMGVWRHEEAYFETAVVARIRSQPDRVLGALTWGWVSQGTVYRPRPDASLVVPCRPVVAETISHEFLSVLHHDFPDFAIA